MSDPHKKTTTIPVNEKLDPARIDEYSLCIVDDVQDEYEYGKLYLVGPENRYWLCVFHCPCGCGELLELLLLKDTPTHWSVSLIDEEHIDLSPSVWKTQGCMSHFFINNNRVTWVPKGLMHVDYFWG